MCQWMLSRTYFRARVRACRIIASVCNSSHSVPDENRVVEDSDFVLLACFFAPASDSARVLVAEAISSRYDNEALLTIVASIISRPVRRLPPSRAQPPGKHILRFLEDETEIRLTQRCPVPSSSRLRTTRQSQQWLQADGVSFLLYERPP